MPFMGVITIKGAAWDWKFLASGFNIFPKTRKKSERNLALDDLAAPELMLMTNNAGFKDIVR